MNEDISVKLWVVKFCIKVVYPKFNHYAFLVFLAIRYRVWLKKRSTGSKGMDKFLIKSTPTHLAHLLTKEQVEKNLPVVIDKCIIISKEQYIQLCSENLFYRDNGALWLVMKLSPESKKKYKDRQNDSKKQSNLLKYNLNFVTSEIHKKLWSDTNANSMDNVRIVPVIGSKLVPENTALSTENEVYNISSTFNVNTEDIEVIFHTLPSTEYSPKIATTAEVSLIVNEHDISNEFTKEVLSNHFEVPKLLNTNDIFSIDLVPENTGKYHYKYLHLVQGTGKLYFKVNKLITDSVNIKNKEKKKSDIAQAYFIVKGVTQLSLGENIHTLKPKDEYFKLQEMEKCYSLLHSCPAGLKQIFSQLQDMINPFITGDINELSESLSSPIMPLLLLTGSLGSGRHLLVKILANTNGMNCLTIDCNALQSSTAKQTESKINATIQKAKTCSPVIVLLDNFEVFAVDPENNEDCRVVEHFMNAITDLYQNYTKHPIIFIAVTDRQDLKPNILRLFLDKIHIPKLNSEHRYKMLEWLAKAMQLNIDGAKVECNREISEDSLSQSAKEVLKRLAAKTETFLYGDLDALLHFALRESFMKQRNIYNQTPPDPDLRIVKEEDFNSALESIRSLQSQHLDAPKIPKVYWEDIGGLDTLKKELLKTIEFPIKYPHLFKNSSLKRSGILMYGPPGCGKTLVAKAVSTELNVSFLSVKGPELLNMYIGQSEENVRKVFESARASSPCIVFLDELDALAPRRGAAGDSGGASDRVVSQLLAELDGVAAAEDADSSSFVFVMGATNRPDLLEQSLLRPGRLDKMIYVGPYCGLREKTSVLTALCRKYKLRPEVNLEAVAEALPERCTGADLMSVVGRARAAAVRNVVAKLHSGLIKESELSPDSVVVGVSELWQGVESFRPSVTEDELAYYESLKNHL